MSKNAGLTPRQRDVTAAIRALTVENGRRPSMREIGARVSIRSTHAVIYHLTNLQRLGVIEPRRYRKQRDIALTERGKRALAA